MHVDIFIANYNLQNGASSFWIEGTPAKHYPWSLGSIA